MVMMIPLMIQSMMALQSTQYELSTELRGGDINMILHTSKLVI